MAEQITLGLYSFYSAIMAGVVYPVVVREVWSSKGTFSPQNTNGWVSVVDFAGSGVIHAFGGFMALFASIFIGRVLKTKKPTSTTLNTSGVPLYLTVTGMSTGKP